MLRIIKRVIINLGMFLSCLLLIIPLFLIISFLFMLLWNWLAPALFNLGEISYYQTLGLAYLGWIVGRYVKGVLGP